MASNIQEEMKIAKKEYRQLINKAGYRIIYDKNNESEFDDGIFMVLYKPNPNNEKEPFYAFYDVFMGSELALMGYIQKVHKEKNIDEFYELMTKRIIGSTTTKSGLIAGLLTTTDYDIDDIYKDGKVVLIKKTLKGVSGYINFRGGRNPRERGVPPKN